MEAPAGLAVRCGLKPSLSAWKPLRGWRVGYPCHMPKEPGLIQPIGLARPQPGLQPAAGVRRWTLQKSRQRSTYL